MDKQIKESARLSADIIRNTDALLIVAGAGMGIDSGLPDYRGPNGLWNNPDFIFQPARDMNLTYEDLSTHQNFIENPELAWGFQSYLTRLYHDLEPHQGYHTLLKIATEQFNNNYFVVTSNVDSQFLKSGFNTDKLYEVHGTKRLWQCVDKKCNKNHFPWDMEIKNLPKIDEESQYATKPLPKCIHCNKMARPNVSFFDDLIFNEKFTKVQSERLFNWLEKNKGKKLAIIELGCGVSTHSIRFQLKNNQYTMMSNEWKLPKSFLSQVNTNMIRINPDEDEDDHIVKIKLGAKKGLTIINNNL